MIYGGESWDRLRPSKDQNIVDMDASGYIWRPKLIINQTNILNVMRLRRKKTRDTQDNVWY